ncbi:MAG: hypothetical protein JRJ65_07385 [Deltaproteobacteria bacterium]|nr:hypothetical protein [Deltaproteobacteria bacterium]
MGSTDGRRSPVIVHRILNPGSDHGKYLELKAKAMTRHFLSEGVQERFAQSPRLRTATASMILT